MQGWTRQSDGEDQVINISIKGLGAALKTLQDKQEQHQVEEDQTKRREEIEAIGAQTKRWMNWPCLMILDQFKLI